MLSTRPGYSSNFFQGPANVTVTNMMSRSCMNAIYNSHQKTIKNAKTVSSLQMAN